MINYLKGKELEEYKEFILELDFDFYMSYNRLIETEIGECYD